MQIKTIPDGYNSGRAYYIRGESSACKGVISNLGTLSHAARISAEKRTRFEHNQLQASACCGATLAAQMAQGRLVWHVESQVWQL
jgi:hypothetical protein